MATTIGAYSASLALDASSFIKEGKILKKEQQSLTRLINSSRGPLDKHERAINLLDKAYRKGAITLPVYNRLIDEQNKKLQKSVPIAKARGKELQKNTGLVETATKRITAFAAAWLTLATAQRVLRGIWEEMQRIDERAKLARGIGADYNRLVQLQLQIAMTAGVAEDRTAEFTAKLTKRAGEAALGMGEVVKTFEELNINVDEFARLSPVERMQELQRVFSAIEDPTRRAALAVRLFDSEGKQLLAWLGATNEQLENATVNVEKFGLALTPTEIGRIEATNDALMLLEKRFSALYTTLAKTPRITETINIFSEALQAFALGIEASMTPIEDLWKVNNPFADLMTPGRTMPANYNPIRTPPPPAKPPDEFSALTQKIDTSGGFNTAINPFLMENTLAMRELPRHIAEATAKAQSPVNKAIEANSQEAIRFTNEARRREAEQSASEQAEQKKQTKKLEENKRINKLILDKLSEMGWGAV